jgi:hypothetical protein
MNNRIINPFIPADGKRLCPALNFLPDDDKRETRISLESGDLPKGIVFNHLNDNGIYLLSPQKVMVQINAASRPIIDGYAMAIPSAKAAIPAKLRADLANHGEVNGPDVVVVEFDPKLVEIDVERHMPVNGRRNPQKPLDLVEVILLMVVQAAGYEPFSLVGESGFDLFMPISPAPGKEDTLSGVGRRELTPHVDNLPLSREYRPDVLALMGHLSTEPVPTSYVHVDDILPSLRHINPLHEETLCQPLFRYFTPSSFHFDGSKPILSPPMPIIEYDQNGRALVNYNQYRLEFDQGNKDALSAIDALNRVLSDKKIVREEHVTPGKVLLLSNTRVLHARGAVKGMRYLSRLYGKRDLSVLRALPSGGDRICKHRFAITSQEMIEACKWKKASSM